MQQRKNTTRTLPAGRIPLALLQEPDITMDTVKAFAYMDYLRKTGKRGIDSAKLAEWIGISEEKLNEAAEYLSQRNWIELRKEKPAGKGGPE